MTEEVIEHDSNEYYACHSTKTLANGTKKVYVSYRKRKVRIPKENQKPRGPKRTDRRKLIDICQILSLEEASHILEIVSSALEAFHLPETENEATLQNEPEVPEINMIDDLDPLD
jgi:hypothetical protein